MKIFDNNPTTVKHGFTPSDISVILGWAKKNFASLPLLIQNGWKEFRNFPDKGGKLMIGRMLRYEAGGWNEELHRIRLESSQRFWSLLNNAQVPTSVLGMDDDLILAVKQDVIPVESHICHEWPVDIIRRYYGVAEGGNEKKLHALDVPRTLYNWCNPDYDDNDKSLAYEPMDMRIAARFFSVDATNTLTAVTQCLEFALPSWKSKLNDAKVRLSAEGVMCSELSPLTMRIGNGKACWRFHPSEIEAETAEWLGLLKEMGA
jgi:hypothetical protein